MFNPVKLTWGGKEYVIPPDQVLRAIAIAEEIVTVNELVQMRVTLNVKFQVIAKAYASLLRFAGAKDVTDEQVFCSLFPSKGNVIGNAFATLDALMVMMTPPMEIAQQAQQENGAKKQPAA